MWILKRLRKFFNDEQFRDDLAFFRDVILFHGLSTRQLGRLMQAMQRRTYHAGEELFVEGQIGKAVFIIRSGRVELTRNVGGGDVRTLGLLGAGQIFGELALIEQRERTASATVIDDGAIYLLYTATLESLIRRYPDIGIKLMKNMAIMISALLRKTNREVDQRVKPA